MHSRASARRAVARVPSVGRMGRCAIYVNRVVNERTRTARAHRMRSASRTRIDVASQWNGVSVWPASGATVLPTARVSVSSVRGQPVIVTDIDECATKKPCHRNAVCVNTPGTFFCQCDEGFSGDGVHECKASFLFAYDNHTALPRNTPKAGWQLRQPLKIFDKVRDKILVSGTIIVSN